MQYAVGMQHTVAMQYAVGTQYAVGMQYTVGTQYAVGTQYTVCMQYAVGISAKRFTHTVDLANTGGGDHYLYCKNVKSMQWGMQYAVGMQYTVGMQYAVGVSAKRSTYTLDSENMGGGDCYL